MNEFKPGDIVRWNTSGKHGNIGRERMQTFGDIPLKVTEVHGQTCIHICHLDGSELNKDGFGGHSYWDSVLKKDDFLMAVRKRRE